MEIVPVRQEYVFSVISHTMKAVVDHVNDERHLNYFFDDKLVATKIMAGGEYYTDDDCIKEVVDDYKKNKKDVYADLFNNHMDKIRLAEKRLELNLVNFGIVLNTKVKIVKDYYEIDITTGDGDDQFHGKFKATDFSEVLEKMRLFINVMEGVSAEFAQNISLLSNDKIAARIDWQ